MSVMSGTLPWYVAQASGLISWGLLAASVIWGAAAYRLSR